MKISGKLYMHIIYTFIWWKPQWPSQQPQSKAGNSCLHEWWPPCQGQSFNLRSWPWRMTGWYEGIYWPLSQIRTTWNNLKGYNLLSWETTFPSTRGPSDWPLASPGCAWQWGHPHGQNTVCLFILIKKISDQRKFFFWFGLGGFLLHGAQRF